MTAETENEEKTRYKIVVNYRRETESEIQRVAGKKRYGSSEDAYCAGRVYIRKLMEIDNEFANPVIAWYELNVTDTILEG